MLLSNSFLCFVPRTVVSFFVDPFNDWHVVIKDHFLATHYNLMVILLNLDIYGDDNYVGCFGGLNKASMSSMLKISKPQRGLGCGGDDGIVI